MAAFQPRVWISPELKALQREFPRKMAEATRYVVNEVAFGVRDEMIESINYRMIVRYRAFVRRHVLVQKASRGSFPVAEVGSIKRGKFEGWAAQQFGDTVARDRVPTLRARGGQETKAMLGRARLKPGNDFPTAKSMVGKSNPGAVIALMRILARRGDKRPFIVGIDEHPKIPGGLYEQKGRKDKRDRMQRLHRLQEFDSPTAQPARLDWVNPAWKAYQRNKPIANTWRMAFGRVGWQGLMGRA